MVAQGPREVEFAGLLASLVQGRWAHVTIIPDDGMVVMDTEEIQQRFRKGRELFHDQRYFECHEVWEDLWRESAGPLKQLLQGLIQAAVGFHHWHHQNPVGARRVWTRSLLNLRSSAPLLSLEPEVRQLQQSLDQCIAACLAGHGDHQPLPTPHLALERLPIAAPIPGFPHPEHTS